MAQYRLTAASYLNDRYFPAGATVEWDGPPNKAMVGLDEEGNARVAAQATAKAPVHHATEVPQPGGEPPDPTWAPDPRPAFAVKTSRVPDSKKAAGQPKSTDKEASIARTPASPTTT